MKQVWVVRHGDWVQRTDTLTEEATAKCLSLRSRIGPFSVIIASPFDRAIESARLITGHQPEFDARAGIAQLTSEETNRLLALAADHTFGRAGVLFGTPAFIPKVKMAGQQLVNLISETLEALPEDGKALIVSHDGTLCAAEKVLKQEDFNSLRKTYYELEGFIVSEEGFVRSFTYRKDGEL